MEKSLSISKILKKKINKKSIYERLLTEEGAYASLSVGDLLYDYLRVDPEVVKTLDIIHPNDDLSNPILAGWYKKTKMDFFSDTSSNPEKAFEGHENRDFGYSAERYFGQQFQNQGAEVSYPETLNNPGFDLYVNGTEVQSKVGSSNLIDKHFEKYPAEDYPNRLLVTNTEAAEEYIKRHPENADKIIDGGPIKDIKEQYFNSSNSAKEIFDDEEFFSLPIAESISIGLIISATKNTYKFIQDKKTFSEALVDTGIDAASRAGTIGISAATGGIVIGALSGGPYGIIAGKIVGGVLGLYPGRKVSTLIKHSIRCKDEQTKLENAIKNYLRKLNTIALENMKIFENKEEVLSKYLRDKNKITAEFWEYLDLKLQDEKKYKNSIIGKISQSTKDVWSINEKAEYLSSIADEVIFLGGKIGIGPMFLKNEYDILINTSKGYNKCIDKII